MVDGIITGFIIGGVLSLPVMGIAVVYGITGVTNFSLGIIGVFGAFITWILLDYNWVFAVFIGILFCFVIGYILQNILLNRVSEKGGDKNLYFIITVSLGLVFTG